MIALVRVDNRLIHGQVVEAWLPELKPARILVADDGAAGNALTRAAMGLAVPPPVKVDIMPVGTADFAAAVASPERVLVLLRDVAAALSARERGLEISRLNLGNVHFAPGRVQVSSSVYLSPSELVALRALAASGAVIDVRAIPKEKALGMSEIEAKLAGPTPG
ncbi:MAG TPA: PTS sugar transporter subunit IIB [Myxococcales bacterium]|jgi:PTS system mannose-specific IIB component